MADHKILNNEWVREEGPTDASFTLSGEKYFEIHVRGQLDKRWSAWLEGMEVRLLENGEMVVFGPVVDQAALMGVLNKISSLNLKLVSVNEMKNGRKNNE